MAVLSASMARTWALRGSGFSLAKARTIGFRSGLYGGR